MKYIPAVPPGLALYAPARYRTIIRHPLITEGTPSHLGIAPSDRPQKSIRPGNRTAFHLLRLSVTTKPDYFSSSLVYRTITGILPYVKRNTTEKQLPVNGR